MEVLVMPSQEEMYAGTYTPEPPTPEQIAARRALERKVAELEARRQEVLDRPTTYSVDGCVHDWPPDRAGLRKCRRCGVRVLGSLAHNPPARGIDWSHTVIINMAPEEKTT